MHKLITVLMADHRSPPRCPLCGKKTEDCGGH